MHAEARAYVALEIDGLPRGHVVEFGARDINGGVRDLFDAESYVGVDLAGGHGVDVIADARSYDPPKRPDVVVCCEVLEHTPDGAAIMANAYRILKPGGLLILTCATEPRAPHSAHDGGTVRADEYYGNVDPDDLSHWLARFVDVHLYTDADRGDLYATARKPSRVKAGA